jgi:asparagine synthase (glutamine-hydrolysing)
LDLQTVAVGDRDFVELMPTITEHYGYPFFRNPHSIPFLQVSYLVRNRGVKAVLSGEGSDECFLGYSWFAPSLTRWRRKPIEGLKQLLNKIFKPSPAVEPYWQTLYLGNPTLVRELHNRFEVALEADEIRQYFQQQTKADLRSQIYSLDLLNYNLRTLLHRNDTMGMAASIESRFPFLDSQLVKLAVNLPYQYKIRLTGSLSDRAHPLYEDKWILRQVGDRYLPKSLSRRPKKPFTVNTFERFQFTSTLFQESFIQDLFGLSSQEMDYLFANSDRQLKLKLLHLDIWGDLFIRKIAKEKITKRLKEQISI